MKKSTIIILVVVAVLALTAAVGVPLYIYNQNNYVAKVGDAKISKAEYTFYLMWFKQGLEQQSGIDSTDAEAVKSFWKSKASDGETWEATAKNFTLERLKQYTILLAKAKEKGVTLTNDEKAQIKSEIDNEVTQTYGGKRVEADKNYKKMYGINLNQYEKIRREYDIINKYQQSELTDTKATITADDAKKTYDEDTKAYDKISVRHILYLTVDATTGAALSDDKVTEASNSANAMKDKVAAGEDMIALAKANSQDPNVSNDEGLITYDKYGMYDKDGNVTPFSSTSDLDANFKAWAADKNVGDAGVVQSQYGYHVMKLENKITTAFDAVKDNITSELAQTKLNGKIDEWMKDPKNNVKMNDKVYNTIKIVK